MSIFENLSLFQLFGVLILSLVPTIILLLLVLYSDKKSREPLSLIFICIFSGFFTISFSMLLGKITLPQLNIFRDVIFNSESFNIIKIIILAMIEEYSKLMVLYVFMSHNKKFDDIYDGFVYSALIALSFAGMETILYVFNESTYQDMTSLAVLRDISTIPLHLVCGIAMGYYVAIERFSKTKLYKLRKIAKSIIIPTFIHSVYNCFFSLTMINLRSKSYALIVILLFLLSIYAIGVAYLRKIIDLNKIFISNGEYPKEYYYLMTKDEFMKNKGLKESKYKNLQEIIYDDEDDFEPFNNNENVL